MDAARSEAAAAAAAAQQHIDSMKSQVSGVVWPCTGLRLGWAHQSGCGEDLEGSVLGSYCVGTSKLGPPMSLCIMEDVECMMDVCQMRIGMLHSLALSCLTHVHAHIHTQQTNKQTNRGHGHRSPVPCCACSNF